MCERGKKFVIIIIENANVRSFRKEGLPLKTTTSAIVSSVAATLIGSRIFLFCVTESGSQKGGGGGGVALFGIIYMRRS